MVYLVNTPWWLKKLCPALVWDGPVVEKVLYLTFDDGPHPEATPLALQQLKQYNAKATFFCIGKNVAEHRGLYAQILAEGHATGNHTQNHLNGWKTSTAAYIENIQQAAGCISSSLFRPPYGRITRRQAAALHSLPNPYKIIMWNVLSGDFDVTLSPQACLNNVLQYTKTGSIIVFHDSGKAFERMRYALPRLLEHYSKKGYVFRALH